MGLQAGATLTSLMLPISLWAQDLTWQWDPEMRPIWWLSAALGASLLLLILFGWALLNVAPLILAIVAAVLAIRWLMRATGGSRSDPAVSALRERYARGDITKEDFQTKLRDLRDTR